MFVTNLFLGLHRLGLALRIFTNWFTSPQFSSHYRITYDHNNHRYAVRKCQKDNIVSDMEVCEEKKQKFDQQKKDNEITNHLDDDLTEREHQIHETKRCKGDGSTLFMRKWLFIFKYYSLQFITIQQTAINSWIILS